ncbi:hypothetical protein TM48_01048 [Mycobacterium shottsii]|nr:hypothetical protein TM48_01048 [Mycobacterium shottsii]
MLAEGLPYLRPRLYAALHNHGPAAPAHGITQMPGDTMWIIELNVAGYRFTREMPDLPRKQARLRPRHLHWPVLRHSHGHSPAA